MRLDGGSVDRAWSLPDETRGNRLGDARIARIMFQHNNGYLPLLVIRALVDETKNAGGRAKPFCTIIERPNAVGPRKSIQQPLN